MINWYSVGFSALWIFGLSLEIAVLSHANYLATQQGLRLSRVLETFPFRALIRLGLAFFCLGMIGIVGSIWERSVWAILALVSLGWILMVKKAGKK